MRALIVVTNHATIAGTGTPTGYYMSEVSHPWHVFTEAGIEVDFASPKGGFAPMDPKSFDLTDKINKQFWHTLTAVESLLNTHSLAEIDPADYEVIFFSGGHGTMWDFPEVESVSSSVRQIYEQGGVVGAVCHGPAALVNVTLEDGTYPVDGKQVASFTNEEEEAVNLTEAMPFLLETKLRERGAEFKHAPAFKQNVAVDGRLVTGQNPASATVSAEAIVKILKAREKP